MANETIPRGLGKPSISAIETVWKSYIANQQYRVSGRAVKTAFRSFPNNRSEAQVRIKACILNEVFSTNMVDTGTVARHIASLRIDRRLRTHDPTLERLGFHILIIWVME